ncbi:cytoplasm protein [Trichosporon asahii var. asahii CBS 2479]|uniref:Cytoplasm protein n=1 Tax=Trichosporon asahii var. asahii (strain ATCC 90039 / CBS 2479 / JCM 2466 / KCTC 7840 / NBRC 103889/ NCYC 2677 / UAMH 7654) TaxID=1186058 RepID=J6F1U1_TRIAS|nr:cytoplasm protein [Trichosporon asahii var. asahii CBS 2479]EJT49137.1 cytoplasm protein [Trichosporon asahii var. asahii CBS 2479]
MSSDDEIPQSVHFQFTLLTNRLVDSGTDVHERRKVPLTLLTGYLGAGKSTLLEEPWLPHCCVHECTDIESKSLQMSNPNDPSATTSSMLSLPNGCLCCSFKDMGIAAIEEMVAAQKEKIDWVIVELTGLADPAPIAKDFWTNEEMGDLILDSVVCVVDCRNVLRQLDEPTPDDGKTANSTDASGKKDPISAAQKQIACSDVILLNKTDLVTPEQLDEIEKRVRSINPTLRVYKTEHSKVPLPKLYNLKAFSESTLLGGKQEDDSTSCAGCSDGSHDHSHHTDGISTVTLPLPRQITFDQFQNLEKFLQDILWKSPTKESKYDILRTKGYMRVDVEGKMQEKVVQGVADLFDIKDAHATPEEVKPKIVLIGRDLDGPKKESLFREFGLHLMAS